MLTEYQKSKFQKAINNIDPWKNSGDEKKVKLLQAGIYLAQNEPEVRLIRSSSGRKEENLIVRLIIAAGTSLPD